MTAAAAVLAMENLTAARWQMTVSLAFHIVFAAVGIGLPLLMVIAERLHVRTGRAEYRDLARKWATATGLLFAVGAVSGTALSFELGLLWPKYTAVMGAAVGHMFALEGYAFFVEAIFMGLYLYGWGRLSAKAHWWCGVVVAASGAASGVLVLGVNAWMQVPIGFEMKGGVVTSTAPLAIFGTYAWWTMALHSTLSCYVAVGFAVAAVYAAGYLKGRRDEYHRAAMRIALAVGAAAAIVQPVSGDLLAKFVYQTQPAKFAAMEAHFETGAYAPVVVGGVVNAEAGSVAAAVKIPGMLSFLAAHDFSTRVKGLNEIPREDWPNVGLTHVAFDVMVGIGTFLMTVGAWFFWRWWRRGRGALFEGRWMLRAVVLAGPLGFVALEAGWVVTEAGRQPWVIQGVMRTGDAVTGRETGAFLWGFVGLYVLLGGMVVVLLRAMGRRGEATGVVN